MDDENDDQDEGDLMVSRLAEDSPIRELLERLNVQSSDLEARSSEHSKVEGTLEHIAEVEKQSMGIRGNHTVMFAGLMCPVIADWGDEVTILHGNHQLRVKKDAVHRALSGREKPRTRQKWDSPYSNPLLPPHRR